VRQPHLSIHVRQRQRPQQFVDVAELGALGAQEAAPRRHAVEQVAHLDLGAGRMLRRRRRQRLPASTSTRVAWAASAAARGQREPRHRRDRRQRLAAEAQREDALEVVEAGDLAGRVAGQRQRQLGGRDAAAVVAHADQPDAAFLEFDIDAQRTGVERVLDQFLDHRGGSLDDFAGRDLVDQRFRELADGHGLRCGLG
jgi:hypothetical protein